MVQRQCSCCALSIAFRQRERTVCSGALPLMRFATAACCTADGQPAVRRSHSIAARWQPEANFHCLALLAGCHAAPVLQSVPMSSVVRSQDEVAVTQQSPVGVYILRIDDVRDFLDQVRQFVRPPLHALFEHMIKSTAPEP